MAKKNTRSGDSLTYETLPALFTGICDAIRSKDGTSAQINHQDIPAKISAIVTGIDLSSLTAGVGKNLTGDSSQSVTSGKRYLIICLSYNGTSAYPVLKLTSGGATVTPDVDFVGTGDAIRLRIYDIVATGSNIFWSRNGSATHYIMVIQMN